MEVRTKGLKRMAPLRALLRLALSDVHQYYPQPATLALHRICIHPLHAFRPLTPQPNDMLPVPDMLRNNQIGKRRPKADEMPLVPVLMRVGKYCPSRPSRAESPLVGTYYDGRFRQHIKSARIIENTRSIVYNILISLTHVLP
jgi:hypothetical protein